MIIKVKFFFLDLENHFKLKHTDYSEKFEVKKELRGNQGLETRYWKLVNQCRILI